MAAVPHGKILKRADPSTIQDKFLVGYQGWFTCAGDGKPIGPGHHGWLHWFTYPIPDGGRPNTDLWPDTSEYSPSELYPAPGLKYASGDQAFLFSSRHRKTVNRHFHWMALHGVDGAFLQRFVGQCDIENGNQGIRDLRDEVGDRVREAAEQEGRVFAIMYDVAGVDPNRVADIIQQDWLHLIHEKGILDSPNYLREKGKAVVTIWGFGFADTHHDPASVRAVTSFIRDNTPGGAYIMAGTPAHWRSSYHDADPNPEFVKVWLEEFDAISPWTVGRYTTLEDVDSFAENNIKGDVELIRKRNEDFENGMGGKRKVDYIPVILPGGSGFNLSEGNWSWNGIPRRGGNFLWRQLFNVRRQNVRTIYGAMWDEYDEGTAFMPVVSKKRELPVHEKYNFMALDEDGFDLPPDCLHGERLIHETFPSKELQDYWSSRPKYEDKTDEPGCSSGSGSNKEKGESWEEWEKIEKLKEVSDEPPPPPYTLEADETRAPTPGPSTRPTTGPADPTADAPPVTAPRPPLAPTDTRPTLPPSTSKPTLPVSSKPSSQYSYAAPPPIVVSSRPTHPPSHPSSAHSQHGFDHSVSVLTDGFGRQSLTSSPSPRLEPPPLHPAHPEAKKRPISPQPNSYMGPPEPHSPSFPSSSYQAPQAPFDAGPTSFPIPGGFASQYNGQSTGSGSGSGSWSQPSWPPAEWGVSSHSHPQSQSPSPPLHSRPSFSGQHTSDSQSNAGYRPGYVPAYQSPGPAPAPPLSSYPSHMSSFSSPYGGPVHTPSPPIPSSSPYGHGAEGAGGFQFPQGPAQHASYGGPQPNVPYAPYGPNAPPPSGYPGSGSSPYPPYGSGPPPPGPGPYGEYSSYY
ncbi:unnamed protein product [Somion occarium]|uniref:Xylosidase/arabinosidase n=1 Tax=Somion occarium TaxID=3059160 RepID=A0ABP1CM93_9APHY